MDGVKWFKVNDEMLIPARDEDEAKLKYRLEKNAVHWGYIPKGYKKVEFNPDSDSN